MGKLKKLRASTKKKIGILSGLLLAFAVFQALSSAGVLSSQITGMLVPICYNIILAVSLNLTVGVLGELSLGHAGFMCIGAFTGGFIVKYFSIVNPGLSAWAVIPVSIIAAAILAGIFGLIVGIPVLRLRGDYLAIVTLAFGEIIWNLLNVTRVAYDSGSLRFRLGGTQIDGLSPDAENIINGSLGITGGLRMDKKYAFAIAFVLMFITVFIVLNFIHSRTGRAVKAIRDNSIAAQSVGINITKYKLITLGISAAFAGVAGALYAFHNGQAVATQNTYGYVMSINILVFVVLGGMGSTLGSIIAATVLTILPEWLRFLNDYRMLIYALVLIIMMLFNSNPTLKSFIDKVKSVVAGFVKSLFAKNKKAKEAD